jgi:hypothetical protein
MRRLPFVCAAVVLVIVALFSAPSGAGQGARSFSLEPAHEDLTFWVNHNGLSEIDVEGEIGFGDMARILMRRRANAPMLRKLRDRFVFSDRDFAKLTLPDGAVVAAAGRVINIPVIAGGRGFMARLIEREPGRFSREAEAGGQRVKVNLDVRPLVRLKVKLSEPARVYVTAADGLAYAPKGSIARFAALPAEPFFHAEGGFELELPAGRTVIEAVRGLEYRLARHELDLEPGKDHEAEIKLSRWVHMARRGFYSADAHVHANYTAGHHQVITPADVRLMALAEDLNNTNLMVANSFGALIHDREFFEGQPHALSGAEHILYWNEEMRNAGLYGHMCLFGLKRLVEPVYTGFRGTPQSEDYPPNFVQARAARAQGGAVTYAHPGYAATEAGASARELPVDAALGAVDAMDVLSNNPEEVAVELWYKLLNAGIRLGISAGTDSFTNVADHYTPGGHRVYARLAGPFSYAKWIAEFKRGHTFATNGPMIWLTVNGAEPGDELKLAGAPQQVFVNVKVDSNEPPEKIELVVNGRTISPAPKMLRLERSAWIAARAAGPWNRMVINDTSLFAHTSPVYVTLGGKPIRSAADARYWQEWITQLMARTRDKGQFSTEEQKKEVLKLFAEGRAVYERLEKEAE